MAQFFATRLVGVPHYRQGTADGLCVLYSMSMLLASMFPSLRLRLQDHSAARGGNPILRMLRKKKGPGNFFAEAGEWLTTGYKFGAAKGLLNEIAEEITGSPGPLFRTGVASLYKKSSAGARAMGIADLRGLIDQGLPFMAGGDDEGDGAIAHHAVVVIGYARYEDGTRLAFLDPSKDAEHEWEDAEELFSAKVGAGDIIYPARWPNAAPPLDRLAREKEDGNDDYVMRVNPAGYYERWPWQEKSS